MAEESLNDILQKLESAVDTILVNSESIDDSTEQQAVKLLTAAVRLYSGAVNENRYDLLTAAIPVSTTEAATVAAGLLLSQDLSVFEFNGWFARVEQLATTRKDRP